MKIYQNGLISHQLGQLEKAIILYKQVLSMYPMHFEALHQLGVAALQTKNPELAAYVINKAIEINPNSSSTHSNLGIALKELGRLDDALTSYEKAITLNPNNADAFNNRGNVLKVLMRFEEALESYDKAIAISPNFADAFNNRGNVLKDLMRLNEALSSYNKAISLKPANSNAYKNRGNVLVELKSLDDALSSYDKAIAINPSYADAFNNRGITLKELKRLDDALASYDKAIAIKPDFADAFNNRGNVLKELSRFDDALASYNKAIALKPDYADAFYNRGNLLRKLKKIDDALASYEKANSLKPNYNFLLGTKINSQMYICDWSDLNNQLKKLEAALAKEERVTPPFSLLGLMDKPELQLKASRIYVNEKYRESFFLDPFKTRFAQEKIRIGYYSADFHNHATTYLMAQLFEAHDSQKFELYGFSFGPETNDEMRSRVAKEFDYFFDVTKINDRQVAQLSRDLRIDIAVDLKGFTEDARTGIFAEHCAPIQINYLGYPGTSAAPYFDYLVADKTLIPQESQQYYSEKIIYMPHSYQVNDSKRKISRRVFTRQELGLPERGFVFCCFNNNYKILPATFDVWVRLLKKVNGSVLWLLQDNPTAAKNLHKEAAINGIDPSRIVFAPRMKLDEHLARHRLADLFIDTLPYNAHTTASDALWAELPVLTQMGKSFPARVTASLLNAMNLQELITTTQEEYEARAIELANNPLQLAAIRKKLHKNRATSPLFDGIMFARHIEAAYSEIHRRYLTGEYMDHIYVEKIINNPKDMNIL